MTPYEMMLSESQERMLMVLKPGKEPMAEAIFRKWELDFAVIGEVTDTGHMVLEFNGEVVCDIPLAPLADDAPLYDRPHVPTQARAAGRDRGKQGHRGGSADADRRPGSGLARWIFEQYDSQVGGDTLQKSGGDAAVVRIHGTDKALAISTDCTPRYCFADPYEGGKQAVAETSATSAPGRHAAGHHQLPQLRQPAAPRNHGPDRGRLEGMGDACRALDYPIVSGNVSLYNESKATGGGSDPADPAIGGVGLMLDHDQDGHHRVQGPRRRGVADRSRGHAPRPVALAARDRRSRGRPCPRRGSGCRAAQWRDRAPVDR
jgi:phosphoribosylformylglycinamidine synthase